MSQRGNDGQPGHRVRRAPCRTICEVARAQHSESEHFESEHSESVGMRHLGAAPQVLAQGAAARWRLTTGTARRAAPWAAWLGLSTQLEMEPPPAACAVPPSPCSAVPSMGKLHRGHTFFFFSHSSAQPEWKVCKHGSVRTCGIGGLHGSEAIRGHPRPSEGGQSAHALRGPLGRRAALSVPSTGHVRTHLVATANVL